MRWRPTRPYWLRRIVTFYELYHGLDFCRSPKHPNGRFRAFVKAVALVAGARRVRVCGRRWFR